MKLKEVISTTKEKNLKTKDDLIAQEKYLEFYSDIEKYLKNNKKETEIIKILKYFKFSIDENIEYEKTIKKENGEILTDFDMVSHHKYLNNIKFIVELKFRKGEMMTSSSTKQIRNTIKYLNSVYTDWRYLQIIKNEKENSIKTIFLDCEFFK